MLDNATELKINPSFTKLSTGELLISLSDDVVKDLSTDQSYGYRITQAIRTGELLTDLTLLEIGPVSHSRWLTTANRLCRMWVSNHGLTGKTLNNLKLIVEYVVGVYYPCWLLWMAVVDAVLPTVQRSAWYAFSEMIIQALLCSSDSDERRAGVQKILDMRGGDDDTLGDFSVRPRSTPVINPSASSLLELIDWSDGIYEPPLTCKLTTSTIREFIDEPVQVPQ
jgi:hypothetical protein